MAERKSQNNVAGKRAALGLIVLGFVALSFSCFAPARAELLEVAPVSTQAPKPGGWRGLLLGNPLDINEASLADLESLPRVGALTARAILYERDRIGGFATLAELRMARGVGESKLRNLEKWMRVR